MDILQNGKSTARESVVLDIQDLWCFHRAEATKSALQNSQGRYSFSKDCFLGLYLGIRIPEPFDLTFVLLTNIHFALSTAHALFLSALFFQTHSTCHFQFIRVICFKMSGKFCSKNFTIYTAKYFWFSVAWEQFLSCTLQIRTLTNTH